MKDSALETMFETGASGARRAERQRIIALMDDARSGRARVVELAGDPGSGKTRLLNDLAALAVGEGMRVLRVQCGETSPDVLVHVLEQAIDRRGALPGGTKGPDLLRATLEQARQEPLALLIDDFHWAGKDCVEFIDHLVRWPLQASLLVVVAHRPRQTTPWLRAAFEQCVGLGALRRIELGPLTCAESASILGLEPDDDHVRELHADSGGNPHYLLALAAIGREAGPLAARPPLEEIIAPFATRVLGEVAPLGEDERAAMDAAAVLGGEFDLNLLAATAGIGYEATCDAAIGLVRRDLLRSAGTDRLALRHPVLGRVLYRNIAACSRELAHWRAAEFLAERDAPAAARAAHLEFCLGHAGAEEVRVLVRAAAQTAAEDPKAAARWCHVALRALRAEQDCRDQRSQLLLLARTLGGLGWLSESHDISHALLRLLPEPTEERGAVVLHCAITDYLLGRRAEAQALLGREVRNAERYPPQIAARVLVEHMFLTFAGYGRAEPGQLDRALHVAEACTDDATALGAILLRALRETIEGEVEKALPIIDTCGRALDGLADAALSEQLVYAIAVAWLENYAARFVDAERHLRRAAAVAEGSGNLLMVPFILNAMIYVDLHVGPLKAVETKLWPAYSLGEGHTEDVRMVTLALESTAALWTGGEDMSRALRLAEESFGAASTTLCGKVGSTLALASASKATGNVSRCLSLVLAVGGGPALPHIPNLLRPMCFEMLCHAAVATGSPTAEDWAARAEAAARTMPMPHQRAYALAARGHLARRRGGYRDAARIYTRAADLFGSVHMNRVRAVILLQAASCLEEAGEFADADAAYSLAEVLGREYGATSFGEDVGRLRLRSKGQRLPGQDHHPQARRALAALTNREREIAVAASTGKRTREIAAELHLSPRTVDVHLTRIYRKLGLTSRAALANLITELNVTPAKRPA